MGTVTNASLQKKFYNINTDESVESFSRTVLRKVQSFCDRVLRTLVRLAAKPGVSAAFKIVTARLILEPESIANCT